MSKPLEGGRKVLVNKKQSQRAATMEHLRPAQDDTGQTVSINGERADEVPTLSEGILLANDSYTTDCHFS